MMVQGFDAADPAARQRPLDHRGMGRRGGSLGAAQPRPQGGYGALLDWLAHSVVWRTVHGCGSIPPCERSNGSAGTCW
jgi:hypothetical protein